MTREEFEKRIRAAVEEYIADEEAYDDNAVLQIDPDGLSVEIVNSDESDDSKDCYEVMDLVCMSPSDPGRWEVDGDAVGSVASEYDI